MKIINIFLCLISSCVDVYSAERASAFRSVLPEPSAKLQRIGRLSSACNDSCQSANDYQKSMNHFAKERTVLRRDGIQIANSADPKLVQEILKTSRDRCAASQKAFLLEILQKPSDESCQADVSEADLILELNLPFTPISADYVKHFWEIKKFIETNEKVYSILPVSPDKASDLGLDTKICRKDLLEHPADSGILTSADLGLDEKISRKDLLGHSTDKDLLIPSKKSPSCCQMQ